MNTLNTKILIRRGQAESWNPNFVLAKGELGVAFSGQEPKTVLKIGDGNTIWKDLPEFQDQKAIQNLLNAITESVDRVEDEAVKLNPSSGAQTIQGEMTFTDQVNLESAFLNNKPIVSQGGSPQIDRLVCWGKNATIEDAGTSITDIEKNIQTSVANEADLREEADQKIRDAGVFYTNVPVADYPNRRSVQLANHNFLSGLGAGDKAAEAFNLATVSKENVADFGSKDIHLNLNTNEERATINGSEQIAFVSEVEAEKDRAEEAEEQLTEQLSAEVAARQQENQTLTSNLAQEVLNRTDKDTELQNSVEDLNDTTVKNTGAQIIDGSLSLQLSSAGSTGSLNVDGDATIKGNLTVNGTTTTTNAETLAVKDNLIITNDEGTPLNQNSGLVIRTGSGNEAYAIVYDPDSTVGGSVKLGIGAINADNEFAFTTGDGEPVATRADSKDWKTNAAIAQWDAVNHRFVDSKIDATTIVLDTEFTEKIEEVTASITNESTRAEAAEAANSQAIETEKLRALAAEEALSDETATKVAKVTSATNTDRVYGVRGGGLDETTFDVSAVPNVSAIVKFTGAQTLRTYDPVVLTDATNKRYVDNAISSVNANITALQSSVGTLQSDVDTINKGSLTVELDESISDVEGTFSTTGDAQTIKIPTIAGPTGPTGATPTFAVGSTTTGDAGTNAEVTVTPPTTGVNYILNFKIPRGAIGATGATGATGAAGRDGRDGAAGPTGPTGADGRTGPTGPTGPAGPTRTLTVKLPTSTGFADKKFNGEGDATIKIVIDDGTL